MMDGISVHVIEYADELSWVKITAELTDFCSRTDFFDPIEVQRLIKERKAAQVWYLFNFALWWKEYIRD